MKRVGFVFEEGKAPPRQGAIIQFDGEDVGTVTSGTNLPLFLSAKITVN